jgi:hypothetical protein
MVGTLRREVLAVLWELPSLVVRRIAVERSAVVLDAEVAMLFIDFESPGRRRINGSASLHYDDPLLAEYPGAQLIVRVKVTDIFGNCPRYVHKMELKEYAPHPPARLITAPTT